MSKAIWGYLSDKLTLPTAALTKENVKETLKSKQVDENYVNDLLSTLDACEMALFAPSGDHSGMEKTYKDTLHLLTRLEEAIK